MNSACPSTLVPAFWSALGTIAENLRRAVGSPVALAPGGLVPKTGGELIVVPRLRQGAFVVDAVHGVVDLGAVARVPKAPVADGNARVAEVQIVVGEGTHCAVGAVAPVLCSY